MSLNDTPLANRVHISLFGKRNSGKSSLLNAFSGQDVALVSEIPGTTTDVVRKTMEIHGIGPCVIADTAGFDDVGKLGSMRVEKTKSVLDETDIAILLLTDCDFTMEKEWYEELKARSIPVILVISKIDLREQNGLSELSKQAEMEFGKQPLLTSSITGEGVEDLRLLLKMNLPEKFELETITGDLVSEDDTVLLVMPQDIQAPKGRLILPQVQTIRDLLDHRCTVVCTTGERIKKALDSLSSPPALMITDSQVFPIAYENKPPETRLTSFSILFAAYKGDLRSFVAGAGVLSSLNEDSRILIAEACSHAPLEEDIGRVKIPAKLRKLLGQSLQIDIVSGKDFPKDLSGYDLVIHCGACMFNRQHVLQRLRQAKEQGVPMTNYGVILAELTGILDKIDLGLPDNETT